MFIYANRQDPEKRVSEKDKQLKNVAGRNDTQSTGKGLTPGRKWNTVPLQ